MPVCLVLLKIIKVWRALGRIKEVKLNAYRQSIGLPPRYGCCRRFLQCLKRLTLRILCPCFFWKLKSGQTTWQVLWTDGTLANSILKSLFGLILGLILTQAISIFLIFQLNFDPVGTVYASILFGSILTLGLAFSVTLRCFLYLTLPQFFTKKGRAAILAYCLILALSGPGKNTTQNMEILTESLLCSQEMAHNATQGLINLVKDPYSALGGALKAMVDAVQNAAASIMASLRALINMITAVVNSIKAVLKWLKNIMSFCNDKVGSPSAKCRAGFDEAISDCRNRLGSAFGWMCAVVDLAKQLCYLAEWTEGVICWLPGLIKESVLDPIKNGLKDIGASIKKFFDVRIRFDYELEGSFTSSKSFRQVVRGMKSEILNEIHWLLDYMDWVNILASLFMGLALYKALIYRHRFLTIDRHDNFYITKGIVQLDLRMRRLGRDPVFPLKYRESFTYVQTFSLVLVPSEQKALKQQLVFVGLGALKILIYVFIDYVFYQFLLLVQKYGAIHVDTRKLLGHGVTISGHGFMADMYRAILEALSPIGALLPVFDTSPCLPIPSKPNYYRYAMIFFLLIVCFIACVTEPYGMRLRHIICDSYYPERRVPRDRWLYANILTSRENFIFYARNELRAMLSNGKTTYRIGIIQRLSHTSPCFRRLFSLIRAARRKCFLCGLGGDIDDTENFVDCPKCDTVYCNACYEDVGRRCVACLSPIEFGTISEESGSNSSDDEDEVTNAEVEKILKQRSKGIYKSRSRKTSSASSDSSSEQGIPLLQSNDAESLLEYDTLQSLKDVTLSIPSSSSSSSSEKNHSSDFEETSTSEFRTKSPRRPQSASASSSRLSRKSSSEQIPQLQNSSNDDDSDAGTISEESSSGSESSSDEDDEQTEKEDRTTKQKEGRMDRTGSPTTSSATKYSSTTEEHGSSSLLQSESDSDDESLNESETESSSSSTQSESSDFESSVSKTQPKPPRQRRSTSGSALSSSFVSQESSSSLPSLPKQIQQSQSATSRSTSRHTGERSTYSSSSSTSSDEEDEVITKKEVRKNLKRRKHNRNRNRTSSSASSNYSSSANESSTLVESDSDDDEESPSDAKLFIRDSSSSSSEETDLSDLQGSSIAKFHTKSPLPRHPGSVPASSSRLVSQQHSLDQFPPPPEELLKSTTSSSSSSSSSSNTKWDPITGELRRKTIPRKRISSALAERIARLDSFYAKMPYPPCSQVYK